VLTKDEILLVLNLLAEKYGVDLDSDGNVLGFEDLAC
jgi:hypothetical protein